MKNFKQLIITLLLSQCFMACEKPEDEIDSENKNMATIEIALDKFVITLQTNPPAMDSLPVRIRTYLSSNSTIFYGSTVAYLDAAGKVFNSPYLYRKNGIIMQTSLMDTAYKIDKQNWLRLPIDLGHAIWTSPYFDAGGGEIWMRTRSVPIFVNGKIIAVATTDLQVDKP